MENGELLLRWLDHRAYKAGKKPGQQLEMKSARVGTIRVNLTDEGRRPFISPLTHGRAMQQNAAAAEKLEFLRI